MDAGGLAYREAGAGDDVALLVHGYPESSYMWRDLLRPIADAGWRAIAPDLPGYGDSPLDRPGTWTRHVEALERFRTALGLERVALVVHDWGGLIGLRWACEHPDAVRALVVSDTGFHADGRWHGLARAMRTAGQGEQLMEEMTRDRLAGMLGAVSRGIGDDAIDEYWRGYADMEHRLAHLDLYRSGEFSELERYEGCLTALGVPALVLWGADDPFAPVAGAHRFARELPGSETVVVEGAGHFVFEDEPERTSAEVARFLASVR